MRNGRRDGSALRISYPGAFYHVTSRGNERKAVSRAAGPERFLGYWPQPVTLRCAGACDCLMDNTITCCCRPQANLPEIMHHINGRYTLFNIKRPGPVIAPRRYKAILVESMDTKERRATSI